MNASAERTIVLVRQRYTAFGGAERFAERALRALTEQGAQVALITRSWRGDAPFAVEICNPFYIGRLWRDLGFARCVRRRLARLRAQPLLVQSHERIPGCDVYRAGDGVHREWLAQRARVLGAAERWAQRLNPYHRYVLAAERRLFAAPGLKAVICNSGMVREEIRRNFGLPADRLHVIYSGVDTERFHPRLAAEHRASMRRQLGIAEETPVFLFVGSGYQRKGLDVLLDALTAVENGRLVVVGKDRHIDRYRRRAQALGLDARVRLLGPVADVRPYYGMADVLVLPTLYDPFPNVALEAMAAGLPVITSRSCGAAELIEQGGNGFVCDALDRAALTAHMRALAAPERRRAAGAAARRTVEPLTLAAMGRELLRLYGRLSGLDPAP